MFETWKPVIGYEGIYKVSDLGRVCRTKTGRILRPVKDKKGYYQVSLYKEGIPHTSSIHSLVLIAFVGLPPESHEGNHKNGIKSNNELDNLEWLTHKENQLHASRVLGIGQGEDNGSAKLRNHDIPVIRRLLAEGKLLQREIGAMFGVNNRIICRIKLRQNWAQI